MATTKRRGHGEDAIYFDAAKNRYFGAVSLGFGPDGRRIRRKVTGTTKAEVKAGYTVGDALDDWLSEGVDGLSARTVLLYRGTMAKELRAQLGDIKLRKLTAGDVQAGLKRIASRLSTRSVQICHNVLVRAILVQARGRPGSQIVATARGQPGGQVRPVARTRSSGTASRVPAMRGPCGTAPGRAPHSPRVPRN